MTKAAEAWAEGRRRRKRGVRKMWLGNTRVLDEAVVVVGDE